MFYAAVALKYFLNFTKNTCNGVSLSKTEDPAPRLQLYYDMNVTKLFRRAFFRRCSLKKVLLDILQNTEKHLRQSLFINKVAGLRKSQVSCNFIKKETQAQVFSCEFCKDSKNPFSYRTPPVAASPFLHSTYRRMFQSFVERLKDSWIFRALIWLR